MSAISGNTIIEVYESLSILEGLLHDYTPENNEKAYTEVLSAKIKLKIALSSIIEKVEVITNEE